MSSDDQKRSGTIPLVGLDLSGNEERYLASCIRDGWVSSAGPFVTQLEQILAQLTKQREAVATASGSAALYLVLKAMGVAAGDYVVVPDWTFAATVNAVIHAGATPIFVDVAAGDWSLDPVLLNAALSDHIQEGHRVAAVIMVDPAGAPASADDIVTVCRRYAVPLIEDAAGSIGSSYRGRPCGSLGDAGIISFNGNKVVTAGGGGAILTDDADLGARSRHISTQARTSDRYRYDAVGFNFRLPNINAALAVAQLERLEVLIGKRCEINRIYDEALKDRDDMRGIRVADDIIWNGWMYLVRVADAETGNGLVAHLAKCGIQARPFWESLSAQQVYSHWTAYDNGISRKLSGTTITLPNHPVMNAADTRRIASALDGWRGKVVEELQN